MPTTTHEPILDIDCDGGAECPWHKDRTHADEGLEVFTAVDGVILCGECGDEVDQDGYGNLCYNCTLN